MKRAPCWRHSTSRSGSEARFLKRGYLGDANGEEELG
jgi:hypothetical protein